MLRIHQDPSEDAFVDAGQLRHREAENTRSLAIVLLLEQLLRVQILVRLLELDGSLRPGRDEGWSWQP